MSLSLVAALALMQTTTPAPQDDIMVLGKRTAAALSTCIERKCPTQDDVRLSIAHAESQFAEGKYADARTTLQQSIRRNRDEASRLPRHVAALYEAYSTVSLHYGDMDDYRRAAANQARVLRTNLPNEATDVLLLDLLQGDIWLKRGNPLQANRNYQSAERGFRKRGLHKLEALTALRRAGLSVALGQPSEAQGIVRKVDNGRAADDPAVRTLSAVIAARIAISRGDDAAVDQLLSTLRTDATAPPMLLDEPDGPGGGLARVNRSIQGGSEQVRALMNRGSTPAQWADIGFMVTTDGTVTDVQVLRGNRALGWTKPIVEIVESRRYVPIALPAGQPGLYRVERFTLRPQRTTPTGSLIKTPSGAVTLETLDMTQSSNTAPPST